MFSPLLIFLTEAISVDLNILHLQILTLIKNENECSSSYSMLISHTLCTLSTTLLIFIPYSYFNLLNLELSLKVASCWGSSLPLSISFSWERKGSTGLYGSEGTIEGTMLLLCSVCIIPGWSRLLILAVTGISASESK